MCSSFNPADKLAVEISLEKALNSVIHNKLEVVRTAKRITQATTAWVWYVEIIGEDSGTGLVGQKVLRISHQNERHLVERQVHLTEKLISQGFPVARSFWHGDLDGYPAELQERLPGEPAINLLSTRKARMTLRKLAELQAKLHSLSTSDSCLPDVHAKNFLSDDLEIRRQRISATDNSPVWNWLCDYAELIQEVGEDQLVLCHGDFHPMNALVTDTGDIALVDWSDACLSDRHNDVGRTLATYWFGAAVAQTKLERFALKILRTWLQSVHINTYEQSAVMKLEQARLIWWQVAHLYKFWLQLAYINDGGQGVEGSTTTSNLPTDIMKQIMFRCELLQSKMARLNQ